MSPGPPLLSEDDDETRQLLQRRLWLVFTVLAAIFAFATLGNILAVRSGAATALGLSYVLPLGTLTLCSVLAALALRLRLRQRSRRELRTLDAAATVLTCWTLIGLFLRLPASNEAALGIMLAGTYVMMARAVVLPSSGRRTLAICLVSLLPMGMAGAVLRGGAAGHGPAQLSLLEVFLAFRPVAVTTFLASVASNVIYGLRKKVRESARIGQYLLQEKIGQGGMGVVYRATHALLRRETAIKLLSTDRVGSESLRRFEREVKLTAQLTHPNTVAVFDYGRTPDGVFYYAMEYLAGGDLEELVEYAGPLPPARAISILVQVCRALREAHSLGLVHRDIKPNNVLLCERGLESDVAKVVDFGLVKDLRTIGDAGVTMAGSIAGTPLYMPPEAATGQDQIDARADLYSLGAVGYFLLVGEPVFKGKTMVEICAHHLHSSPRPPSEDRMDVPPDLDAVILRCLAKRPEDRFSNVEQLRDALLSCRGAGSWTTADGAAWWSAHRIPFRDQVDRRRKARLAPEEAIAQPSALAIAVDFEQRSPLPSPRRN